MATRTCNDDSMWPVILRKLVRARLFYLNKKKGEVSEFLLFGGIRGVFFKCPCLLRQTRINKSYPRL